MTMFRANTMCQLQARAGFDEYGDPQFGPSKRIKCSVVRLARSSAPSSVRADSSGSRGKADQMESDAVILMPPSWEPSMGAKVAILGMTLEIVGMHPRLNIMGRLDHYEVSLNAWPSASRA